jgi:hypothetical protein
MLSYYHILCCIFDENSFLKTNKVVDSTEQKAFMIESYFGNGHKVNDQWSYSVQHCLQEFHLQFPQVVVDCKQLQKCLDRTY